MKLKLETLDNITILLVTEDVQKQHAAILRAGLNKLFQSGKTTILLDLGGVTEMDENVEDDLRTMRSAAQEQGAQLVIASPIEGVGQAPNREIAVQQMQTPMFHLMTTETELQFKLNKLEKNKTDLNSKFSSFQGNDSEILKLRQENSELKSRSKNLEIQIQKLYTARVEAKNIGMLTEKLVLVDKVVTSILQQDGVLAAK